MPLTLSSFCERRTVTQALTFVCGLSCAIYNGMEKMKWRKPKTEKKNLRFQNILQLCAEFWKLIGLLKCVNGINA